MRYIIWLTHGESVQVRDVDLATQGRWMALRDGVVIGTGSECDCEDDDDTPSKHDFEHFTHILARQTPEAREQVRQSLQRNIDFTHEALQEEREALEDYTQRLDYLTRMYGTGRDHTEE